MISQKATILCILEILRKYTDEDHCISTEKIREKLKKIYDIDMERRTIYRNIDALRSLGIEIQGYYDNREGYCLIDREFEPSEIRMLCDAVAASDMIKSETSKQLIKRLSDMLSVFQSRMLQRTIYVKDSKTPADNTLFYKIDTLNVAINQGNKVYMKNTYYDHQGQLVPTKDSPILFNPYATIWAKADYYVVGKDESSDELTHYRIDRLKDIKITELNVEMMYRGVNLDLYAEQYIYQKGEQVGRFDVECDKDVWQELVERFGENVTMIDFDGCKLMIRIRSVPSVVRSWVLEHCDKCEVIEPKKFRDEIRTVIMEGYKKYW